MFRAALALKTLTSFSERDGTKARYQVFKCQGGPLVKCPSPLLDSHSQHKSQCLLMLLAICHRKGCTGGLSGGMDTQAGRFLVGTVKKPDRRRKSATWCHGGTSKPGCITFR